MMMMMYKRAEGLKLNSFLKLESIFCVHEKLFISAAVLPSTVDQWYCTEESHIMDVSL